MAEGDIDKRKPIHLDYFTRLLEIHFPGVKLIMFMLFQSGGSELKMKFATPLPQSLPTVPLLNANAEMLSVPSFSKEAAPPSQVNASQNQTIPAIPHLQDEEIITGDRVFASVPTGTPNYKGYTTLQGRTWVKHNTPTSGFTWAQTGTGPKKYWDFEGASTTADKIPVIPPIIKTRGLRITEDDAGRIYMGGKYGLSKWDKGGKMIFAKGGDTAVFDPDTNQISVVYTSSGGDDPSSTIGAIEVFDLAGTTISRTPIVDEFNAGSASDVSRGGKLYGLSGDGSAFPGIKGYNLDGANTWTIPGEEFGSFQYGDVTAYGEDYIVVGLERTNGSESSGSGTADDPFVVKTSVTIGYRIYSAATGSKISETIIGDHVEITSSWDTDGGTVNHSQRDTDNYASIARIVRSQHWP